MMQCGLFDGTFNPNYSASFGDENLYEKPESIEWVRNKPMQVTFFTDLFIPHIAEYANNSNIETRVAWLIKPSGFSYSHYEAAVELEDQFDIILCHERKWFESGNMNRKRWRYYPFGGSWIKYAHWGLQYKTKTVSMITTNKRNTAGHAMRHAIEKMTGAFQIDIMGHGVRPIASKQEALKDYRFSIVVESTREVGYFSEKLIDCLSQGTIPVYWGCPDINKYFDADGIIPFENINDLAYILINIANENAYNSRLRSVERNLTIAHDYRCAEDWISKNYPEIFDASIR